MSPHEQATAALRNNVHLGNRDTLVVDSVMVLPHGTVIAYHTYTDGLPAQFEEDTGGARTNRVAGLDNDGRCRFDMLL